MNNILNKIISSIKHKFSVNFLNRGLNEKQLQQMNIPLGHIIKIMKKIKGTFVIPDQTI